MHSEIDSLELNQSEMKSQLNTILEKLEIIQEAVFNLKNSYEEETKPSSPVLIADIEKDGSYKWFGSSSSPSEPKQLTLKQLALELANPTLARIAEVLQLAVEKIKLVQTQSSELEEQIKHAASSNIQDNSFEY